MVLFFPTVADFTSKEIFFFTEAVKPVAFIVSPLPPHTHTGCSPGIWERATDPSILGSKCGRLQAVAFFVLMKVSHYLLCLQTAVLAVLILSRGRCKSPLHLHHGLSLATYRLSTCPVSSITMLTWQTLPKSLRIIYIICAINLQFTHCIK